MPAAWEGRKPHRPLTARQGPRHLGGVGGEIVGSLSLRSLAEGGKRGVALFIYLLKPVPEIVGGGFEGVEVHSCKCLASLT